MSEIDTAAFEKQAALILERILAAFDDIDPDVVEAIPSDGVVKLDFQGARTPWVVNSQRGAKQIWLAAEQRAWHFAPTDEGWITPKTGEELFATLNGLLSEHAKLTLAF